MRPLLLVTALGLLVLGGCGRGGGDDAVPAGDSWREEVVAAIDGTPGVSRTLVTVSDVDSGFGHEGPVVTGGVVVTGEAQPVVDDLLRRASEVLGQDSAGVRINLTVSTDTAKTQHLDRFGYGEVTNGRSLWEATH